MRRDAWKQSLNFFFSERAFDVVGTPSFEDLCYISGRDSRLWSEPGVYQDLVCSIVSHLCARSDSRVLEVGCASGFLARGVAPEVRAYVGIDLSMRALKVARRLGLRNARFERADGVSLPFLDGEFDGAFCYDVFTNFPDFEDGAGIIAEMLRIVKPGARVLVGSIPDKTQRDRYEKRVADVGHDLEQRFGPPTPTRPRRLQPITRRLLRAFGITSAVKPEIVCYYFSRKDFADLGTRLGARVEFFHLHARNPYATQRFNVVYTKQIR